MGVSIRFFLLDRRQTLASAVLICFRFGRLKPLLKTFYGVFLLTRNRGFLGSPIDCFVLGRARSLLGRSNMVMGLGTDGTTG